MFNIEPAVLSSLREEFPEATRVRLLSMDDPHAPPVGSSGTVIGVDDGRLGHRRETECLVRH